MYLKFDNLSIRSASIKDANLLCQWWNDGKVMEHAGFPNGLGISSEVVTKQLERNGVDSHHLMILEVDSVPVGEMAYRDKGDKIAEIGIKICNFEMQGKGYGTTFLKMLIDYLFEEKGFSRIILDTNLKNTRAQHVYEKLGFRRVGVRVDSWKNQLGELQSSVDYELTRAEVTPKAMKQPLLEEMSAFFTARVDMYDEHMLNNVEGCREGYNKMAELIPESTETLLDLGCGTGLELEQIFKRFPVLSVVGIDLSQAMLERLQSKFPDKEVELICGNYFDVDLGEGVFDTAISFQTMHHFGHAEKVALYTKIHKALKLDGVYIEGDYMVTDQAVEDQLFAECARLRQEMNLAEDEFYHFDTPCTIDNQIMILKKAGFRDVNMVWRVENTTLIVAKK